MIADPADSSGDGRSDGPGQREVPAAGRWPEAGLTRGAIAVRVWEPDDVPQLLAMMGDAEVRRWSPIVTEPSEQDCRDRVQRARESAADGRPSSFAVVDAHQPTQVLGSFDWRNTFPPGFSIVDVGYMVAQAARGRGVASTALALVSDWLLDPSGGDVERVQLDHAVENVASCRTAVRAGFVVEGRRARFLPLRERPDAPVVRHEVCLHGRVR